jgi:hypothetical protein
LRDVAVVDGMWHTTELSDFGVEVDIQVPAVVDDDDPQSFPRLLYEVAGVLWRAKRAYARRPDARNLNAR